ncbi:hypothetical protein [Miltoncostaea marina]|uniref:hypothetical protein n=1 Tax=Miltoncostaea marina TaxID=2843215 RepID=UPI001C3C7D5C|nr:hypothetical protein [Miltoncostaea marina]
MSESIRVRNPHGVPVEVPGVGVLNAGAETSAPRSARLRRALEHGRLEVVGEAPETTRAEGGEEASGKSSRSRRSARRGQTA